MTRSNGIRFEIVLSAEAGCGSRASLAVLRRSCCVKVALS